MTEPKTVADVLDALLALYAVPGAWIRDGVAEDAADSPEAVAWSLEGALERVIGDWEGDAHRSALLCGASEACGVDLSDFNDTVRRQEVVLDLIQRAKRAA